MIFIDKIYYSDYTKQIDVTLYNPEADIISLEDVLPGTVTLVKLTGGTQLSYTANYSISYYNPITEGGSDYLSAIMHIDTGSGLVAHNDPVVEFNPNGLTTVTIEATVGSISAIVVNQSSLYDYKSAILNSESGYQGGIRMSKKLSRFSFYEQMMMNAIDLGYYLDAENFYAELERMSKYGIPRINKDNYYL